MKSLRIRTSVHLFGAVIGCGVVAILSTSLFALNELKVNGPQYQQIVYGKDLIADILPPPAYIIEAYLETTLALQDPLSVSERQKRLLKLHQDYRDRKAYWLGQNFAPALLTKLTVDSDVEVEKFWRETEGNFLPAIARGDRARAEQSYITLTSSYAKHRVIIDDIVSKAVSINAMTESVAHDEDTLFHRVLYSVSVLVLGIFVAGVMAISKGIAKPIAKISSLMTALAEGHLDIAVGMTKRSDEVGDMTRAVLGFRDSLVDGRILQEKQAADSKDREARVQRLENLVSKFDTDTADAIGAVMSASNDLRVSADTLSVTTDDAQQRTKAVATGAVEAATGVQTVAVAAEQLHTSIREISRQVTQSRDDAIVACDRVTDTSAEINALVDASEEIGDVVKIINEIAGKTNLLALNATIEAARAGDAGRGFAVVAHEVKQLASKTSEATRTITHKIDAIQAATAKATSAVEGIRAIIQQVGESSASISASIEQQTAATQEIARHTEHMASGVQEVTQNITGVDQATQESNKVSEWVQDAAQQLTGQADRMRDFVSQFLTEVRSA